MAGYDIFKFDIFGERIVKYINDGSTTNYIGSKPSQNIENSKAGLHRIES